MDRLFILGSIIGLVAFCFPLYTISLSVNHYTADSEGFNNILSIHGINGIVLSHPSGSGVIFSLSLPIILLYLFIFRSDLVAYRKQELDRKKIIRSAFLTALPVMLIFTTILVATVYFENSNPDERDENTSGGRFSSFLQDVGNNPLFGERDYLEEEEGELVLKWQIGFGITLLMIATMVKIYSGLKIGDSKKVMEE